MAKIAIKSEKITPFGGIFPIMEQFDSNLSSVIDSTLGMRCKLYGYQYSEIIRSLLCVYFCGGSCVEDVTRKYGVTVHKIDRFFPSSKTCTCGYVNKELTLRDRHWTCPECGTRHHRDELAACNILRQGIAELESGRKTTCRPKTA